MATVKFYYWPVIYPVIKALNFVKLFFNYDPRLIKLT